MSMIDSLPLFHSWPLFDAQARLGMTHLIEDEGQARQAVTDMPMPGSVGAWSCDLATEELSWTAEVHALFGIPEGERLTRALAVSCYVPQSRRVMEMLRAHAIRHRRGFTVDAMIRRPDGENRWMRLSAMAVIRDRKVVGLCGSKQDVTVAYDGPGWRGF